MPIKLFTDGQILDAAEVNTFFMDQALCVFNDATERDASFGLPLKPGLSEGRICYLKSDETIYIYVSDSDGLGTPGWSPQLAQIEDGVVTTSKLDGTTGSEAVTEAKIRVGAVTEAKIGPGAVTVNKLGTGAVTSDKILNYTIMDIDINASAGIELTKLASGSLPTTITVASENIVNGTIMDVDINASALISQSKISGLSTSFAAKLDASATAVNAAKVGGRTVFVQQGTPTAIATGDIWFQVAGIAPL